MFKQKQLSVCGPQFSRNDNFLDADNIFRERGLLLSVVFLAVFLKHVVVKHPFNVFFMLPRRSIVSFKSIFLTCPCKLSF